VYLNDDLKPPFVLVIPMKNKASAKVVVPAGIEKEDVDLIVTELKQFFACVKP